MQLDCLFALPSSSLARAQVVSVRILRV